MRYSTTSAALASHDCFPVKGATSLDFAQVNSFSPGYIITGLSDFMEPMTQALWQSIIPVEGEGSPKKQQAINLYLAFDADTCTTGENFIVDGGNCIR